MHMHSHGSFASLPLIWYWEYTRNATFLTDPTLATADPTATPYALVRGLAEWWVCHLTKEEAPTAKDGYIFSDLDDCAYEDSNYCKHEDSLTLTRESSATSLRTDKWGYTDQWVNMTKGGGPDGVRALLMTLRVTMADGSVHTVSTDDASAWECRTGPVLWDPPALLLGTTPGPRPLRQLLQQRPPRPATCRRQRDHP